MGRDRKRTIGHRLRQFVDLRSVSQPLANTRKDVAEAVGVRVNELTESLKVLSDPLKPGGNELAVSISSRITELTDMINSVVAGSQPKRALRK